MRRGDKRKEKQQSIENCIEQARKKKKGNVTELKDQSEQSVETECQAEHNSLTERILESVETELTDQSEQPVETECRAEHHSLTEGILESVENTETKNAKPARRN